MTVPFLSTLFFNGLLIPRCGNISLCKVRERVMVTAVMCHNAVKNLKLGLLELSIGVSIMNIIVIAIIGKSRKGC